MNKKRIALTIIAIISLVSLVGCNKKVEVELIDGVKVPEISNDEKNSENITENKDEESENFVSGEVTLDENIDNELKENGIIKPTKIIKVSDKFKQNISKLFEIMQGDSTLENLNYYDIELFYTTPNLVSDYSQLTPEDANKIQLELQKMANDTEFYTELKNIVETTQNNMYQGGLYGDSYYQENSYKSTSTLVLDGYDYSVNNLNSLDFATAWVEGVEGNGIDEKITIRMQEYGWVDPRDFGFTGNLEEGYRVMTEEEFNKSDSNEFYLKDEDRYLTYQEYLNNTKTHMKNDTANGYYNTLTGLYIVNGYAKNEELFKANSRVKKLKLTLDGKEEYIIELEDTMNPQLIDIVYKQEPSFEVFNPIEATFEILEVYPGEKYEDTCITSLMGCVDTNMRMGG